MVEEEGQLKGSFYGFKDKNTIFEFNGSRKWRQAGHKYYYYYAYMPHAKVIQDRGCYKLEVEGMNKSVEVRRL